MWVYFCSRSGAALFWRRVGEMIGSRFSGIAVRKSEIAASGPLVPAFEGQAPSDDRSGKPTGLGASEPTISDNEQLRQPDLEDLNFLPRRNKSTL